MTTFSRRVSLLLFSHKTAAFLHWAVHDPIALSRCLKLKNYGRCYFWPWHPDMGELFKFCWTLCEPSVLWTVDCWAFYHNSNSYLSFSALPHHVGTVSTAGLQQMRWLLVEFSCSTWVLKWECSKISIGIAEHYKAENESRDGSINSLVYNPLTYCFSLYMYYGVRFMQGSWILSYRPYLVSLLFAVLISLHLVTFLSRQRHRDGLYSHMYVWIV